MMTRLVQTAYAALAAVILLAATARAASITTTHAFAGFPNDGGTAVAGLLDVNGTLYGATGSGGSSNDGTVFAISPDGTETVLHSFSGPDGANPAASLIDVGGLLYGTTQRGGADNLGEVFAITPAGSLQTVYSFTGGADGGQPTSSLVETNGRLYGTTLTGGSAVSPAGFGTVFYVTQAGQEKVIHSFTGGADGGTPVAGLIVYGGTLYGTTEGGGTGFSGTVFAMTRSGAETVLHAFTGGRDGALPLAPVIARLGVFYGTTSSGGVSSNRVRNDGTVFSVTSTGTETVLHTFHGQHDGAIPESGLIDIDGALYGTTLAGGIHGLGTVFSVTPDGAEHVIPMSGGASAARPVAPLIEFHGALVGASQYGGSAACNCGTVFTLSR